ncbi:hypothetical protein B0H14DRAFT_3575559 [Mycena olivaceomarginata]|nr:hypothetical protein B0H14DRAFT_3575559 [Mycena olivaceomarginata]
MYSFSYLMGGPKTAHTPPLLRMPDFTTLPANFASLILAGCFYGILIVLFVSTIYFLATQRTLAGEPNKQTSFYLTAIPWSDRPLPGYNGDGLTATRNNSQDHNCGTDSRYHASSVELLSAKVQTISFNCSPTNSASIHRMGWIEMEWAVYSDEGRDGLSENELY